MKLGKEHKMEQIDQKVTYNSPPFAFPSPLIPLLD